MLQRIDSATLRRTNSRFPLPGGDVLELQNDLHRSLEYCCAGGGIWLGF